MERHGTEMSGLTMWRGELTYNKRGFSGMFFWDDVDC